MKPDINRKYLHDFTVLHISIINRHFETVKILLDHGADIESETTMKRRPLHLAVIAGEFDITDFLLSCGAVINSVDIDNNTALHYASRMCYKEIVELLIYNKTMLNIKNIYGETPLDIVCNTEIFKIFLNCLGLEKVNSLRNNYSRQLIGNSIYHNNRADNIKKILYRDQTVSNKFLSDCYLISSKYKDIEFFRDEKVDISSFKIIELLGEGSFGKVYLVDHTKNKKKFAMKVLNKHKILSKNLINYIITERKILELLKHPFIVQLFYAFQTEEFLYLIIEYCEGKDLSYHLNHHTYFQEDTVSIIMAQILLAIEELHKHGIIYRDLKPDNILLDTDGYVKLTDFGLSKEGVYDNFSAKSFCGSLAYLAPEVLSRKGHGKSVDWYLFGVLMYELLVGIPPFYTTISKEALFTNILEGKLKFPKKISRNCKSLIKELLNRNPQKRLGSGALDANEIKSHPFFADTDFRKILSKKFEPPKFPNKYKNTNRNNSKEIIRHFKNNKNVIEDMKKNLKSNENLIQGWTFLDTISGDNKLNKIKIS